MRRPAIAAALALLAAACSDAPAQECPGEPVALFHFTGTRAPAGEPVIAGLDPVPLVEDCPSQVGPPPYPDTLPPFDGLLSADASPQAAALCRRTGIVLFGQHSGNHYAVEGSTDGAVLASCSPTCSAALHLFVVGDVIPDAGAPSGFQGVLVEEMVQVAGDCGTCLAGSPPACAARYAIQGTL